MVSIRLLLASIALLVVPLASAAPAPADLAAPEPVEVYGCFYGGVTVVVLEQVELRCVGGGTAAQAAFPVQQCGTVAYQVTVGPAQTSCIPVVEPYGCPGGGGYVVVLGNVQVGECTPCCTPLSPLALSDLVEVEQCASWGNSVVVLGKYESPCITTGCSPTCATATDAAAPYRVYYCGNGAGVEVYGVHNTGCIPVCNIHCEVSAETAGPRPVEVRQCDLWGNSVVLFGKYESPCITTGCSPTCATAADAEDVHFRTCNYHPPGIRLYYGDKPVGPCILLPQPRAQASGVDPFPLLSIEPCPEGEGSRLYVVGKQVTECSGAPVTVDLRCNKPAYGVQVYVEGRPVTDCIPLPHGV